MDIDTRFEYTVPAEVFEQLKDVSKEAKEGHLKGQLFSVISEHVVERYHSTMGVKPGPKGDMIYGLRWINFTPEEFVEFLEDLKKFPNKLEDLIRIEKGKIKVFSEQFTPAFKQEA